MFLTCIVALCAMSSHAQSPDVAEEADFAFQLGVDLIKEGRYSEALVHLMLSNRLSPNKNVVFNIAGCYEALGRFDQAYQNYTTYLELEPDPRRRVEAEGALKQLQSRVALIRIESDPPGATIYIDRKDLGARGTTPRTLAVDPGAHQITLALEGYGEVALSANAAKGSQADVSGKLERLLGPVRLLGEPAGAEVRFEGSDELLGVLPSTIDLPVGTHVLEVQKPGYAKRALVVNVVHDQVTQVDATLLALTGQIVVNTNQRRGALIEVDGVAAGFAPAVLELAVGEHEVKVSAPGFDPYVTTVSINQGESMDLDARLYRNILDVDIDVASLSAGRVRNAPSSVTVFTREEIDALGLTTLDDLVNLVPGMQATRDVEQGTYNRFSARGRGTAFSEYVLLMVDGQRINDLYTGGATLLNRRIPLENVKQVEIVRGPGSALYGSNAFLAVINVVTTSTANNASVWVGTPDARAASANLSADLGVVQVSAFAKGFSDKGLPYQDVTDLWGATGDTRDPLSGSDLAAGVTVGDLTLRFRHLDRHAEDFLGFSTVQNHSLLETTRQTSLRAEYARQLGERFNVSAGGGFNLDRWETLGISIAGGFELAPGFVLPQPLRAGPLLKSYTAGLYLGGGVQLHPTNRVDATISLEQQGQSYVATLSNMDIPALEFTSDGRIVPFEGEASFNDELARRIFGASVEMQQDLFGDHVGLTGGTRVDVYDDFGTAVSPHGAAVINMPWEGTLKGIYGQAFRAPNFLELYDRNNPVDFGNAELDAERVQTIEATYLQRLLRVLNVSGTYFHNILTNQIVLGEPVDHPDNPLGAQGFLNRPDATTTDGVEAEFVLNLLPRFYLRGSYTHLFQEDGSPVPDDFGSLAPSLSFWRLTLGSRAVVRGPVDTLPDQPVYVLVDGHAKFEIVPGLQAQFAIQNASNTDYRTPTTLLPGGVPNRGLTLQFGIAGNFGDLADKDTDSVTDSDTGEDADTSEGTDAGTDETTETGP